MADALRTAGYSTAMLGKWHLGYKTTDHLPNARGFDYSLCSFGNADFNEQKSPDVDCGAEGNLYFKDPVDLWENWSPAYGKNGTYTDDLFFGEAQKRIAA